METRENIRMMVFAAMFAALTAVGAFLVIPIGPVPIVLQNLFVLLTGLLLGVRWGLAGIGIYLLAGMMGLPVFAGGVGGIGRLAGPTGGYLVGYLPAVVVVGFVSEKTKHRMAGELIALVLGSVMVYVFGVSWLKILTGMSWAKCMTVGVLPFLPGDLVKIIAAVPIAAAVRPVIRGKYSATEPTEGSVGGPVSATRGEPGGRIHEGRGSRIKK
jgi:biotin transport system substrate-specific component